MSRSGAARTDSILPAEGVKYIAGVPDALPEARAWARLLEVCGRTRYGRNGQAEALELGALETSWYLVAAYHERELVGLGRLVSDGLLYAAVADLLVHPAWGYGVEGTILGLLIERCDRAGIQRVLAPSDPPSTGVVEGYGYRAETEPPGVRQLTRS